MEFWYKGEHFFDCNKKDVAKIKKILKKNKHIIVHGEVGIGKSVFCKSMSSINGNVVYCEVQHIGSVDKDFREESIGLIEIKRHAY